jgi:hypothetical protein
MSDTGTWPKWLPGETPSPTPDSRSPQRFGDTDGTMSDTWTWFDET